jgi:anti-sigma28 factor (negative regulator of flagellin synthesis)
MPEPKMPDSGAFTLKTGLRPTTEKPRFTAEEIEAMIAVIKTKAKTDEEITNEVIDAKVKLLQGKIDKGEIIVDTSITKN